MNIKSKIIILICCVLLIAPSILSARNNERARYSKNMQISSYAMQDSIHWIGTGVGLFKYNSNKDSLQYLSKINNTDTGETSDIAISENGSVWLVINGSFLLHNNEGKWSHYSSSENDLPKGNITKITTDDSNNLWLIVDNRLMKFDGEKWFCYPKLRDSFGKRFRINDIVANKNTIWLHTTESLFAYSNGQWQEFELPGKGYYYNYTGIYLTQKYNGPLLFNLFSKIYEVNLEDSVTTNLLEIEEISGFLDCFTIYNEQNLLTVRRISLGEKFYQRDIALYKIDEKKLIHLETIPDIFNAEYDIRQIEIDNNGIFWFHNRLNFYRLSNSKVKRINLWELVMPMNELEKK